MRGRIPLFPNVPLVPLVPLQSAMRGFSFDLCLRGTVEPRSSRAVAVGRGLGEAPGARHPLAVLVS